MSYIDIAHRERVKKLIQSSQSSLEPLPMPTANGVISPSYISTPPTHSRHGSTSQRRDCWTAPNLGMHASWPLARAAAADTVIKINAKIDNWRCSTVNSHNFICISDTASCSETRIESRAQRARRAKIDADMEEQKSIFSK